ncbi:hypothetical protein tinsulaeT_16470 [Thalassotalea insulae]|uniref:Sulfur carrier protein ThiS n=1 Tax=Thalassotalea insulae TaxID=2056778 RepID=A0ABQ6GSD4_9GAMM|nr:sulfur carrier protein ThiS [Thalassotalea insulae]GLX78307.1 hypothetical protein tinsulaeT_16470 [Thalassotalea insulae]
MNIHINGQLLELVQAANTVADALTQYLTTENQQQSFAVALNGDFVGKADYHITQLKHGDCLDVLFPIQGG